MYQTIPVRYLDAWLEQGYTGRLIDLYGFRITGRHLQVNVRFCFTVRGGVKAFWCAAGMTGWDIRFIIWAAVTAFIRESISAA